MIGILLDLALEQEFKFRKTVIRCCLAPNNMGLLDELFPGIAKNEDYTIPRWKNENRPWELLSSGDSGLISQISEITGGGVFIHPDAVVGDFVSIEGPCYIGANAELRHSAYLRKGSWICEGAVVGHSTEVKNSILLPGAKAPHFNYVGDSIIGLGANLGAGAKLSNIRNDRREVIVTMSDGERVESGLRKLGALIGDNVQLGCNVVTNPGAIISPGSMVQPNETVNGWF
jgi:NDP-sugar pyrophosphorylase family protein